MVDENASRCFNIRSRLRELDEVTFHRVFEAWAKEHGDDFVRACIEEKEALRAELAEREA